ncbi:hypothetical protein GARC_4040 [Paraglaciecola arctica BSs20135]|uniref:Uncharacterized protein n=1 Tax=Paraglaciecola arctica BSs20135 TaxID=493475 RepID=K6YS47_9ALTE|nr:hypothetical protein GARC_4040 [Paraglaciecola arctica BSs20135]
MPVKKSFKIKGLKNHLTFQYNDFGTFWLFSHSDRKNQNEFGST